MQGAVRIDTKVIEHHLRRVYEAKNPTGRWIESGMYQAVRDVLEEAVNMGMGDGSQGRVPLDTGLSASLAHSAEVFSAFKVHRMQRDMARLLWDDQGNLRSFREWRELVTPIAAHQVGPWLETEYSTAVLRAQQAVEWQQFEAEADVLPNLRWVPSTAVHPGADHQVFWNTILPIHHPFWDQHRPGDRWNCHCSLEATDEQPTAPPKGYELRGNGPQPGLNENPAKTGRLFAQSHPYFPQTCAQCAFYQGGIANGFKNQEKDCNKCKSIPFPKEVEIDRERNRKIFERLKQDTINYKDVEFDEKSGGVKATHVGHNFDPEKGVYEEKARDIGFSNGHSVILGSEKGKGISQNYIEGYWNGSPFELASCENPENNNNLVSGLKHCSSKDETETAVLFFPNNDFKLEDVERAIKRYYGLKKTLGIKFKDFKAIYAVSGNKVYSLI